MNDTRPRWQRALEAEQKLSAESHQPDLSTRNLNPQKDQGAALDRILDDRRFRHDEPPPPLRVVYRLAGHIIGTPGNLSTITAASKAGKSAVIGAMLASGMGPRGRDYLGFESSNPNELALLHFDCEQSEYDYWQLVQTALRRAGLSEPPPWLRSYWLTGLSYGLAQECFWRALKADGERFGGIHSALLDGVADLVEDPNEGPGSFSFVTALHNRSAVWDCHICNVLHRNPGSDFKTRGHLGSQLTRKCESNLSLDKDEKTGITTISSDLQRHEPIPKDTGPRFAWNAEEGMHTSVATTRREDKEAIEKEALLEIFSSILTTGLHPDFTALRSTVKRMLTVSARTAERRIERAVKLGVLVGGEEKPYRLGVK